MTPGLWGATTLVCDGTLATNYPPDDFRLQIDDGGTGSFTQDVIFNGQDICTITAGVSFDCFTDAGASGPFSEFTLTQTGIWICEPSGCGIDLTLCGTNPAETVAWALTIPSDAGTGFVLSSIDPNDLTSCTSDGLLDPMVFSFQPD